MTAKDGRIKTYQFSNIYITSYAVIPSDAIQSVYIIPNQLSDLTYRDATLIFENVTVKNLPINGNNFIISSSMSIVRMRNFTFDGSSSTIQLAGSSKNTMYLDQFILQNCVTQAKSNLIITNFLYAYSNDIIIRNMTLDAQSITYRLVKTSGIPTTGIVKFTNMYFANNQIFQNAAIEADTAFIRLSFENCTFINETMNSLSYYIKNINSQSFYIKNMTMENIQYAGTEKFGSYVIRWDQMTPNYDSVLDAITVINSEANVFMLKGILAITNSTANVTLPKYYLDISNLKVHGNSYSTQPTLILFDSFTDTKGFAQIRIINSSFQDNSFNAGGYIVQANSNLQLPIVIKNTTFYNNYKGKMMFASSNQLLTSLPLKVEIRNCNFTQNIPWDNSLLTVKTNSKLFIYDSIFEQTYSQSRGTIILGDYQGVYVYAYNTVFNNNFGVNGGIFFTHYSSQVVFEKCNITNNLALQASIGRVENQGSFRMSQCQINNNRALRSSLFSIIDSKNNQQQISNTTFTSNNIVQVSELLLILKLSPLNSALEPLFTYIIEREGDNQSILNREVISLVKGWLIIDNDTYIVNEKKFINSFASTLTISKAYFSDIEFQEDDSSLITISSTATTIKDSFFTNITYEEGISSLQYLIEITLHSDLEMSNTTFKDQQSQIMYSYDADSDLNGIYIVNCTLAETTHRLFKVDTSSFRFENSLISNISLTGTSAIDIQRSTDIEIIDSNFTDINTNVFNFINSNASISGSEFAQANLVELKNARAIYSSQSNIRIERSLFYNLTTDEDGGAMYFKNGILISEGNTYLSNYAHEGGAVALRCSISSNCSYSFTSDYFDENHALLQGGSIYYNKFEPVISNSTEFGLKNVAQYGPNIAGYPYSIRVIQYDKYPLASGQLYEGKIYVEIIDAHGLRVSVDDVSVLRIGTIRNDTEIGGQYQVKVENGVGVFDYLIFQAPPGSSSVHFRVYSVSINNDYIKRIFNLDSSSTINNEVINFDFRVCKAGEANMDNQCYSCDAGYYSLQSNLSECNQCPDNAECSGGDKISLNDGYWRSSYNSLNIVQCSGEACKGGLITEYETKSNISGIFCDYGYEGNLCEACIYNEEIKYTRVRDHDCDECPSLIGNLLKTCALLIALIFGVSLLIFLNLQQHAHKEYNVIFRIVTSYVQNLTSVSSYNLGWYHSLKDFFTGIEYLGQLQSNFISIDCILLDNGIFTDRENIYFFKMIVYVVSPIALTALAILFFSFKKLIKKDTFNTFQKYAIVSFIVIVFAFYPTVARSLFRLFYCVEIDKGEYWMYDYMEIQCWTSSHLKWSLLIGVPGIVIYVVGLPLLSFMVLKRNSERLDEEEVHDKYKMLYHGLRNDVYYWEYINVSRKIFIVIVNVFLQTFPSMFKALLGLLVLTMYSRIQQKTRPYKNPLINNLEAREFSATMVIFFSSLFFVSPEISSSVNLVVFIVIIVFNIRFIVLLIYCLLLELPDNHIVILLRKVFIIFSQSQQKKRRPAKANVDEIEVEKSPQTNKGSSNVFTFDELAHQKQHGFIEVKKGQKQQSTFKLKLTQSPKKHPLKKDYSDSLVHAFNSNSHFDNKNGHMQEEEEKSDISSSSNAAIKRDLVREFENYDNTDRSFSQKNVLHHMTLSQVNKMSPMIKHSAIVKRTVKDVLAENKKPQASSSAGNGWTFNEVNLRHFKSLKDNKQASQFLQSYK